MKNKFIRTPESQDIMQDDAVEVVSILVIPLITPDNESIQEERAISFKDGIPVYWNGTEFVPFSAGTPPKEDIPNVSNPSIGVTVGTGTMSIDFNESGRLAKFSTDPTVLMYDLDGTVKTFFKDFSVSYDTDTKILLIDGIFGSSKHIVLKP